MHRITYAIWNKNKNNRHGRQNRITANNFMMMIKWYTIRWWYKNPERRWVSKLNESNWTVNPYSILMHTCAGSSVRANSLSALTVLSIAEAINNVANCLRINARMTHTMSSNNGNNQPKKKKLYERSAKNMYYHALNVWDMVRTMRSLVLYFCCFSSFIRSKWYA